MGTTQLRITLWEWLDSRLGLRTFVELAQEKRVPIHRHTIWYYLGGMTLFLFVTQIVTGTLLLLYYRPSAETAFESVQFIMGEVRFGWLVRSIHSWSANLMIATLFVHLASVYFMKAYRPPRELTWVTGVLLLFVALAFGFSGYLLPWNTLAFFATKVGTEVAGVVPAVGKFLLRFLRGSDDVTGATLTRFFAFHVAILPAITVSIVLVHLLLVQRHGMSLPPSLKNKDVRVMNFVPNFLLRDIMGWLAAVGALAALSAMLPWELGEKADPFASAPAGIRPEWYFMFMFQTLKLLPGKIAVFEGEVLGVIGFGVLGVLLLLVPWLDMKLARSHEERVLNLIGIVVVLYVLAMTVMGYWL
jgi:quinol-cytochrome oxidoreductase complex cytochrome b subunit